MDSKLQKKLFKSFPELFKGFNLSPRESCMYFGIETGDGWYNIILDLCKKINTYCEEKGIPVPAFAQIKEKYGQLRVYMDYSIWGDLTFLSEDSSPLDDFIDIIEEAEEKSSKVCECCGKAGEIMGKGWIYCRCRPCYVRDIGQY